jgi:Flp pilus assembly pilin Flp
MGLTINTSRPGAGNWPARAWMVYRPQGGDSGRGPEVTIMKSLLNSLLRLGRDESGGEVLEYALVVGLIVVAAIASITAFGTKVLARWTSVNDSF